MADAEDEAEDTTHILEKCHELVQTLESSDAAGLLPVADAVDIAVMVEAAASDDDSVVDASAEASVAVLHTLHKAIQAYSMSLAVEASNAEMLPGDLEDTRFLKGLRLGKEDGQILHQYVGMGMWRRISWMNHLLTESLASEAEIQAEGDMAVDGGSSGEPQVKGAGGGGSFKDWYMEQYVSSFDDDLDEIRKQPDFATGDVSRLITAIKSGADVLRDLDQVLTKGQTTTS